MSSDINATTGSPVDTTTGSVRDSFLAFSEYDYTNQALCN